MSDSTYDEALTIYAGDTNKVKLVIQDGNDNPITVSTLTDVWFTVQSPAGSGGTVKFQKKRTVAGEIDITNDSAGECQVNIVHADTSALAADGTALELEYFVNVFGTSTTDVYTLKVGTFTVNPGILSS